MIKGRIYTIRSHQTDKYYIGSTTQILCKRLQDHKKRYKSKRYQTSFEILKYDDHYIELLENYECNDRNELRKREGELQREHKDNIVNYRIECRSRKQYCIDNKEKILAKHKKYYIDNKVAMNEKAKQYRIKNIERIKAQKKQYRNNNKETISKKDKQYYIKNKDVICERTKQYRIANKEKVFKKCDCICGGRYTYKNKSDHIKTKKHQKYITDNKI